MKHALITLLLLTGCTTHSICMFKLAMAKTVASGIALGLQCSNINAIEKYLMPIVDKGGICESDKFAITDGLCSGLSVLLTDSLSNQIPLEWGCTATNAKGLLEKTATSACLKVLP